MSANCMLNARSSLFCITFAAEALINHLSYGTQVLVQPQVLSCAASTFVLHASVVKAQLQPAAAAAAY